MRGFGIGCRGRGKGRLLIFFVIIIIIIIRLVMSLWVVSRTVLAEVRGGGSRDIVVVERRNRLGFL